MLNRYVVQLERPSKYRAGWDVVHSRGFKTLPRAIRAAERSLARHPIELTRSGRIPRGWTATIVDARSGWSLVNVDPPMMLVPSVGEVGYW